MAELEERVGRVEGILEQISLRLNHVETAVSELREDLRALGERVDGDFRSLRDDVRALSERVDRNFLWTLGILIPMWVTIIVALLLRT